MKYHRVIWANCLYKYSTATADTLFVTESNIKRNSHVFHEFEVECETISEVIIVNLLERSLFARYILKESDWLLRVGGKLTVQYVDINPLRGGRPIQCPPDLIKSEIFRALGGRYRLQVVAKERGYVRLELVKLRACLPQEDTISKWTFGIVSNGAKNDEVRKLITQISHLKIPEYEVIVCGPSPFDGDDELRRMSELNHIRILPDVKFDDARIPLTVKKNKIIESASYNNLVLMHDRIQFTDDWFEGIQRYGNYFDILSNRVFYKGTNRRVLDWLAYDSRKSIMMSYNRWSPSVYVDGGFIVGKKHIFQNVMYDENLAWDESEDVNLSHRLWLHGAITNLNLFSTVTTVTTRHRSLRQGNFSVMNRILVSMRPVIVFFDTIRHLIFRAYVAYRGFNRRRHST